MSEKVARNGASAVAVPTRVEWGIAVGALFVLGRWPVLFFRRHLASVLGPVVLLDWEQDLYVRIVFVAAELAVVGVALRFLTVKSLLRQPLLLAFLTLAWASTIWSIEPGVTIWRALTLIGAAAVGWYIGERFTLQQIAIVSACIAAVGAAASYIAVLVIPKAATMTANLHAWSGVYANRNELGLVLSGGILSSLFLLFRTPRRWRPAEIAVIVAEVFMLVKTGNRTGPMALAGTLATCGVVYAVRRYAKSKLVVFWASIFSLGTILIGFGAVEWQWQRIVKAVGRNVNLTHRVGLWWIDRHLIGMRPWGGWGLEAVWSNIPIVRYVHDNLKLFPYSAHNGYYEVAIGVGWIGLGVLAAFLAVTLYRAFIYAWRGRDIVSIWPLAFLLFILAANFTESLFVSSEAFWALAVALAFALSRTTTILVRRSHL